MSRDDTRTDLVDLCRSILTAGLPTPPAAPVDVDALDDYRCPNCQAHKCGGRCMDPPPRWERD